MNGKVLGWLGAVLSVSACASHPVETAHPKPEPGPSWMVDAQAANAAYGEKRYADCSRLYVRASEHSAGRARADAFVSAGECELKQGRPAEAIELFRKGLETSPSYCGDTIDDANMQRDLAEEPSWAALVAAFKPVCAAYRNSINEELRQIYREDQGDRVAGPDKIDWSVVSVRDAARRERVRQLESAGQLRTPDDYYHAAMVFQHGSDESSHANAFRLASHAVDLDPNFVKARWLTAASRDRYHMSRLEPQLYGTQFKRIEGLWILWPVDHHITDLERSTWCVPPLESAKKRAGSMNAKSP